MTSDGAIFFWFFAVLFVLRIIAATFVYACLLSEAPECPSCGSETLRIERRGVAWLFPRLRPSWCPACAWEGMLQPAKGVGGIPAFGAHGEAGTPAQPARTTANTESHSGQLPLISKKSSK